MNGDMNVQQDFRVILATGYRDGYANQEKNPFNEGTAEHILYDRGWHSGYGDRIKELLNAGMEE